MRTFLLTLGIALSLSLIVVSCNNTETLPVDVSTEHIGTQIKAARLNIGVTEAELATAVGLKEGNIVSIEKGFSVPTRDIIVEIEQTLGIEIVLDNYQTSWKLK